MPKVDIPRVGIVEFPDTMSQEQILRAIETDIIPNYQRPEYGVIESGIKGLKRGASRMGSMITDTIPALIGSALGKDEYAKRQLEEAAQKEAELQRTNPAQFTSYKQVEGLGDALRFGAETLGESATDILGIIGTGGIGGALGKRAAVKGAEQLAENIAKREAIRDVLPGGVSAARAAELEAAAVREAAPAIQKAQATGQAAGVYLGSYATNTPDVFQSIYENTNQLAPGASLLFGGAVAALDAVLPGQLLKSMTQTEKLSVAEKILERSGMKPSLLRKATATIPQTAAKEGLTEGAQEVITAMAEKFVDDHQDIWDSEHFNRYMESAVRGAVAGGPFGGVQAVGERMGERGRDRQIQQAQQAEEARVAAEQEAQAQIQAEQELVPQTNLETQPEPALEVDVRVLEKKLKEAEKQKIAEGKAADQAQKEAIAELAPKDIDLLNYAKRVGITSTPLYQLTQQAAEIPLRKGAKPIQQTPIKTWDTLAKGDVVALYRGENKDNVQGGVWWTTDKNKAAKYGAVQEASVPVEFIGANAVRGHGGADEFVFVGQTPAALTETNIPPTASLLTADRLKETGLSPRAGIYKRLLDKDLVANAGDIRTEIAKAQNNPNISKNTIAALQSLEAELPTAEQAAPVPEPVAPEEQAAPVPEPVAPQEQPAVEESPADIWEFMDTGVPYEELDAAKKTEWEQAVQAGTSNQPLADDLAVSHLQSPTPQEPVDIGEREAAEFEQPKKSVGEKEEYKPTTADNITRAVKDAFVSGAQFGRWVRVYDTQQEAIEDGVLPKDTEGKVQGVFHDGRVFLIAGNIEQGQELGVFLHEFGVHFGMSRLIGKENVEELGRQVSKWALSSGKLENELARKALARIPEDTDPRDVNEELVAYFVEEAFAAGVTPQGIKDNMYYNTGMVGVADFVRRFLTALKVALRKIGFAKFDSLTAENIVDLAYGAADLELDGTYHGTAALFRKFNHEFMGKGEGAQAFGWGTYLAQRFGIGKNYFETDVERKKYGVRDKDGVQIPIKTEDEDHAWFLLSDSGNNYDYAIKEATNEGIKSVVDILENWRSRGAKIVSDLNVKGTILRVRPTVSEYELLDWDLPINAQPDYMQRKIAPIIKRLSTDELLDTYNIENVDELTGEELIGTKGFPGVLVRAIEEGDFPETNDRIPAYQAASELLDSVGIPGLKFLDGNSRKAFDIIDAAKKEIARLEQYKKRILFDLSDPRNPPGFFSAQHKKLAEAELGHIDKKIADEKTNLEKAQEATKNKTYNLVIFNDKNLVRVNEYRAGDTARPKFSKAATPKQQREENKNVFEKIANANVDNMPPMTQKLAGEVLNTASGLPRSLRRVWLGALSLYQMYQTYGGIIPSIKALDNALTIRDTDVSKRREIVEQKVKALHAVFEKYTAAQKEKFFTIFQNTTLDQIDPLTVTVKETINSNGQVQRTRTYELKPSTANAANPLVKQFYAMPKDVQEAYMDLRKTYDESADEFEKLITKDVTPGTAAKLRTQFELRRIKVYLPLFRQGEYWLSYQDKAGEPVVMAFPSERERQLEVQRARSTGMKEIREFARFEDITSRTNGVPPVGFVSKIMETLKDEQVSPLVLDEVYSAYLSLFPAESIRQMARARKGIAGANKDAVEVYANIGSRLANQLGNLTHAKSIDEAVNNITQEANANGSIEARDVVLDIAERIKNVTAPTTNKLASDVSSAASSASYYMYIAGNASSALINLTQLPIVVYSLLGGKYGFTDAFNAMSKATSMYLNGGKDDNSTFLPDRTFVTGKNVSAEHKALYEDAVKYGIIRRSTAHELVDLRKHTAGDYTGMGAKVRTTLGWMFQNSERANREITLLAAYDLARKGGASPEAARQEAMNLVTEAHGGALSSTGPRYFQGNIGRVVFTFKRFATSQLYLMGKLFNQAFRDSDEKVREIAQRQLFGIYLMAFTFAGAQGLPLYGALSLLAGMVMGDDDEPVDTDAIITEAIGDMAYKGPINQLLNIDIASRTGFNGMFWRDNPKRRSEVGTLTYLLEQAAGPSFSAAVNAQKAFGMISDGYVYRGFESMSPVAVKNVMKGMRYIAEGATNKDGVPIVQDVSLYNAFMQLGGFAPADLAEAYARAGAKKTTEKALLERRTALLDLLHVAKQNGDTEGVREITERIQVFSQKNPEKSLRITSDTISRSERSHKQREREMVDGVHINKNLRRRLDDLYGTADEED